MDNVKVFQNYCNQYIDNLKVDREKGINDFAWNLKKVKIMKDMTADIGRHLALVAKNIIRNSKQSADENLAAGDEMNGIITASITRFGDNNK
jgi:hypothetical protein